MKLTFSECQCSICQSMCQRPCFGTPEDIQKIIDAGFEDRLCVDYWGASTDGKDTYMVQPALKEHEKKNAPLFPQSEEGCTFFKNGKCELHSLGLKPTQGKTAIHNNNQDGHDNIAQYIVDQWKEPVGLKMVKSFREKYGLKEEDEWDSLGAMKILMKMMEGNLKND